MISLNIKDRGRYHGFLEWMTENIGQPGVDWEYITEESDNYDVGVIIGITVVDPQKETLAIMRWS